MAIALGLTLTACSAGAATTAPTPAGSPSTGDWDTMAFPDPCRLLSSAEVAAEFQRPSGPGVRIAEWPPFCQFMLDRRTHELLDVTADSRPDARAAFEQHKAGGTPVQPVRGLGVDAYWLPTTSAVHVVSGPTHITLTVVSDGRPTPNARAHAVALARLALRRSTG